MTNAVLLTPKPEKERGRENLLKPPISTPVSVLRSLGVFGVCISWYFLSVVHHVFFHVSKSY